VEAGESAGGRDASGSMRRISVKAWLQEKIAGIHAGHGFLEAVAAGARKNKRLPIAGQADGPVKNLGTFFVALS